MMPTWIPSERDLHWAFFIIGFLTIGLWETYRPFRTLTFSNFKRWAVHILMASFGHATTLLTPASAAAVAFAAQNQPFGVLNKTAVPLLARYVLAIAALDFVRWAQHVCFHRIELLWRIHRVHHADPDYDLTTTLRFHPLEMFLTQGTYLLAVYILAPPPPVALAVELLLLLQNFFGHANVTLPRKWDRRLRSVLVTPDMHRIHHSDEVTEQNHNFGTMFPWWDRAFRTYQEAPALGYEGMGIGLKSYKDSRCLNIAEMMLLPFRSLPVTDEDQSKTQSQAAANIAHIPAR